MCIKSNLNQSRLSVCKDVCGVKVVCGMCFLFLLLLLLLYSVLSIFPVCVTWSALQLHLSGQSSIVKMNLTNKM